MSNVDTDTLSDMLRSAGLSQRELAQRLGLDASAVSLLLRGKRRMQIHEAALIASALSVPVHALLNAAGIRMREGSRSIPLIGHVDEHGEAHLDFSAPMDQVCGAADLPDGAVAVQYRTAGTRLDQFDAWTAFFVPSTVVDQSAMNAFCIARVHDGATLLRTVRRGYRPGTFNLIGIGVPSAESVQLDWVAPIIVFRP